jgi:hypothetical protein
MLSGKILRDNYKASLEKMTKMGTARAVPLMKAVAGA